MIRPSRASQRASDGEHGQDRSSENDTYSFNPTAASAALPATLPSKRKGHALSKVSVAGYLLLLVVVTMVGSVAMVMSRAPSPSSSNSDAGVTSTASASMVENMGSVNGGSGKSGTNDSDTSKMGTPDNMGSVNGGSGKSGTNDSDISNMGTPDNKHIHVIFSTDCTPYQHWQSYMLYHSAFETQQPGSITRIASGCEGEDLEDMIAWHKEYVRPISDNFNIHFTPAFSATEKDGRVVTYEYFNKPFGLLHFLQNFAPDEENGVSADAATMKVKLETEPNLDDPRTILLSPHFDHQQKDEDVIILLDPDQILLRSVVIAAAVGCFGALCSTASGMCCAVHRSTSAEQGLAR
jgi:hypothetical protein